MGKDNLKVIATELVTKVRKNVAMDWTLRESARAKINVLTKRIPRSTITRRICKTKQRNLPCNTQKS